MPESLIGEIYDAGLSPEGWGSILHAIEQAVGGDVATLFIEDRLPSESRFGLVALSGYPHEAPDAYKTYFAKLDVRMPVVTALPVGAVYADDRDMDFSTIQNSEIHRDFYRPIGVAHGMAVRLFGDADRHGLLSVHRAVSKGNFRPEEVGLLERLAPHLVRSVQLQRQLSRGRALAGALAAGLDHFQSAVFLVDGTARLVELNAAADTLLRQAHCPLRVQARRLTATVPAEATALRRAIERAAYTLAGSPAAPPEVLRLGGIDRTASLGVMAAPIRRGDVLGLPAEPLALVFAAGPALPARTDARVLGGQFGLTSAEASVAAGLSAGESIAHLADRREVSRETVRGQVRSILAKTQTRSQAQLVGLISRSLAVLRRPGS